MCLFAIYSILGISQKKVLVTIILSIIKKCMAIQKDKTSLIIATFVYYLYVAFFRYFTNVVYIFLYPFVNKFSDSQLLTHKPFPCLPTLNLLLLRITDFAVPTSPLVMSGKGHKNAVFVKPSNITDKSSICQFNKNCVFVMLASHS